MKRKPIPGGFVIASIIHAIAALYGFCFLFAITKPNWWRIPTVILGIVYLAASAAFALEEVKAWLEDAHFSDPKWNQPPPRGDGLCSHGMPLGKDCPKCEDPA